MLPSEQWFLAGYPRVFPLLYDERISSEQDYPQKTAHISRGNQYGWRREMLAVFSEQDELVIVHRTTVQRHLKQLQIVKQPSAKLVAMSTIFLQDSSRTNK